MLLHFNGVFPLGLEIPDSLQKLAPMFKDMRDAFEHINERAQGKINLRGKEDAEALTIFDQPEFIGSSVLHYRGKDLHRLRSAPAELRTSSTTPDTSRSPPHRGARRPRHST